MTVTGKNLHCNYPPNINKFVNQMMVELRKASDVCSNNTTIRFTYEDVQVLIVRFDACIVEILSE